MTTRTTTSIGFDPPQEWEEPLAKIRRQGPTNDNLRPTMLIFERMRRKGLNAADFGVDTATWFQQLYFAAAEHAGVPVGAVIRVMTGVWEDLSDPVSVRATLETLRALAHFGYSIAEIQASLSDALHSVRSSSRCEGCAEIAGLA